MNQEISKDIKNLIRHILNLEDGTPEFILKEKSIVSTLKSSDTMSFVTKKDMDTAIKKMADKYEFHACFKQAKYLRKSYEKFITKIPKDSQIAALNVIKFLLCLSEKPVVKFLENPADYSFSENDTEDKVNWGEYLLEGINVKLVDLNESSEYTTSEDESTIKMELSEINMKPAIIPMLDPLIPLEFSQNRKKLLDTVQNTWFNKDFYRELPQSEHPEANEAINWMTYLNSQTYGILNLVPTSIISEYKIMREILWQMRTAHNSFVFCLKGDLIALKTDVTISSVKSISFEPFLNKFVEYINLLEFFKKFIRDCKENYTCDTYLSYAQSVQSNIINPLYKKLENIENIVKDQEETYTLLKFSNQLNEIFEPLAITKRLHSGIIEDYYTQSLVFCSTSLLCRLSNELSSSINKLEQDIKLSVYLQSLHKYFSLIDFWLSKNDFVDLKEEFVIVYDDSEYHVSSELPEDFKNDWFIQVIINKVLLIAKTFNLLVKLRKYDFFEGKSETLHQEFVRRVIIELKNFYNFQMDNKDDSLKTSESPRSEKNQKITDIETVLDWNSDFAQIFEGYFHRAEELEIRYGSADFQQKSLYEQISSITTGIFPVRNIFENILNDILKERYSSSGIMVKDVLINDYKLDKMLEPLRSIYLFTHGNIYTYFQQFFSEMEFLLKNPWRYNKLSMQLKDTIDLNYPDFKNKFSFKFIFDNRESTNLMHICNTIEIETVAKWPLNIVFLENDLKIYRDVFKFLFKLNWGMYVLRRLHFDDLHNPQMKIMHGYVISTRKRLQVFKFNLLKLLKAIEYYVMCFVIVKCQKQFEIEFDKASDLEGLQKCHRDFVSNISRMIQYLENCGYGLDSILECVQWILGAWKNLQIAGSNNSLKQAYQQYVKCYQSVHSKLNRIYLAHY